jgi:hypothetical protein
MKKSLLLLILMCSLCFLNGCGGGSSTPLPPPPSVATHFSVTAPATADTGIVFNFTVTALDAANNVATSYSGMVHFTSTDSQAILPSNPTLAGGTGTFTAKLETDGSQTITATDMGKTTITGVTNSISVATVASRFLVTVPLARTAWSYYNFTVTAGTVLNFKVTALDGSGEPFLGYTGTVSFTSTDGQAELPASSTLTNGTGTFSGAFKTTGNQTITATDTATSSIVGTSISIHVLAPASGFTPTDRMLNARQFHTATLLNDGRVLVAGGMNWTPVQTRQPVPGCPSPNFCFVLIPLASAEIFDPAKGAFTLTGEMSATRVFHTATLLGDGRVLITGGDDRYTNTYDSAEIFDPSTGIFTPTGNMVYARSAHTATLLTNGKVLLAGGAGAHAIAPLSAELFDPATGQFTATGSMITTRFDHTATLLSDGTVLLAGGITAGGPAATAELFDPATGTFTTTGSMSVYHSNATLLKSGLVLMTGGGSATAELFDPKAGTFGPTGRMGTMLGGGTATLLASGKVLVTGGIDADNNEVATAEMFDPANGTFSAAGNMEIERLEHAAILLTNGKVLITGGVNSDNADHKRLNSLVSAELFP